MASGTSSRADLDLPQFEPVQVHIAERLRRDGEGGQQAAHDESARPPGMQHVEVMRFLAREQRRGQRVDGDLDQAIARADQEASEPNSTQ